MPRYFEFSTRVPKTIILVGILIMCGNCTNAHRDSPIVSDDSNIIDKITLENSGLKNEHIEMIDSYLLLFQNIFNPIYEQCEEIVSNFYLQARTKLWFKIPFLFLILGIILSYVKSLLGFSSVSKPAVFYNREEHVSHADIKQSFVNFAKEISSFNKKIDSVPQTGATSNQDVKSAVSTQENTDEMRKKIQNITTSINKNEEALDKFHKEKKSIDSFLLDFQKEVIASQTAIWKELHNVKNILSGKPGSINPVTPKQKEKTQDRTPSSQLNMSNEIEKNSPETTRNMDARPETYRAREEIEAPKHESNSQVHAHQNNNNHHHKSRHSEDISGDAPLSSRSQNTNMNTSSIQNKLTEKITQNPTENVPSPITANQNNVSEVNKVEGKVEEKVEKRETLNTEESQNETAEEKREISPFNRIPPRVGGGMQPFKPGVNTKLPVPGVRKPGPIPGANPFNKPVIPKPNIQGEGA